ncbi:MAG: U32 family peptidase [Acetanaerobacterium sp.]
MSGQRFPEVLAPAGDLMRLISAVDFGADAVYVGGRAFSMRSTPTNFNDQQLLEGVAYAHARGARVYLACNTLPRCEEAQRLPDYFAFIRDSGVDAVIVSDIGVLALARRLMPDMEFHISTQAGVVNHLAANELYALGARRVVLARELSLEEIRYIRDNTPPDLAIEAFVHGAMCVSFSGRCLLSSYIAGRDANRGECAQPCRWQYALMEEKRPNEYYPVFEDAAGTYILNAKDLCMIEHIAELVDAGVSSLKIEGRAKSDYYVSVVTNAYRMAVDGYLADPAHYHTEQWLIDEVHKVSHRKYCTGFFYGQPNNGQYYETGGYVREYDVVAVVDDWQEGMAHCIQRNKLARGEVVEVLQPRSRPFELAVNRLVSPEGEELESTPHPMMHFCMPCETPLVKGTVVRRKAKQ